MVFNATWSPGPQAAAGMQILGVVHDQAALVLYLDPDSLALMPPRDRAAWPEFARFLREVRDGADELARFIDPTPHTKGGASGA